MTAAAKGKSVRSCPPKASLRERAPISSEQALSLESLFGVLANDTRLRLLHAIARQGEICVTDLADALEMKPQAVSNQLQRLSDKGIVGTRREGNNIYYRILDGCVIVLLERGLCLIEETAKRKERVP
ncbi:MAG TPA: metalloregulator ArsR/SmtB family transcription factor [Pirellulales bacterium]|nr:metalloregulator ArsR/SmtB family transcription factor [Pirellulales bacterium]